MNTLVITPKPPLWRLLAGVVATTTAAWLLSLGAVTSTLAQPFTDDFADGNDDGWLHYDVLKAVGGTAGTFEVVDGVYHLHAPPSPNAAYGGARVAAYRPEVYTGFKVAADIVGWDTENRNQFGVFGRLNNPGLGRTGGYLFSFQAGTGPRDNRLALYMVKGESVYTLAERYELVLDPAHRYRMVMTGVGGTLIGELFDLANPGVPLATLTGYDYLHTSGASGVIVLGYKPGGFGDLRIDNYEAGAATGSFPIPLVAREAPVRFRAEQAYPVGPTPGWIDQGDFNGDGAIDLVLPNSSGNNVSVLLNRGDGVLESKVDYPAGAGSTFAKVLDLDLDGELDLVVANAKTTNISVLLGNGDGTFQTKVDYEAGPKPYSIAVGDLNKDGKPDLVVADNGDNKIQVLLGKGDGTLQARAEYVVGNSPVSVQTLDLNGDGVVDVAVSNRGDTNLGVLLGNGDGTLKAMVAFSTEVAPGNLAVGDFNGDGRPDLVTINHDAERLMVLLSNGDGTLAAPLVRNGFNHGLSLAVADMNRDGKLDVVVGTDAISKVYVLLGKKDGTFEDALFPQLVYGGVGATTVADLNRDGFPDVALANSFDNRVQVLLADPSVSDDFADGNDGGWLHYDPLAKVGGSPATFEVKDGAYHIRAPLSPKPAVLGPPRAGAFFPDTTFTDFEVSADVLSWDNVKETMFGVVARVGNVGIGRTSGYYFRYCSHCKNLDIDVVRNEQGRVLARKDLTLDPAKRYRFVFTGFEEYLRGDLYDLANPAEPLVTLTAVDRSFTAGLSGLLIANFTLQEGDAVFDNYSAKVPAGEVPGFADSIGRTVDGAVEVHFKGNPGTLYAIEAATDLQQVTWTTVGSERARADRRFSFIDMPGTGNAARFYRLLKQ